MHHLDLLQAVRPAAGAGPSSRRLRWLRRLLLVALAGAFVACEPADKPPAFIEEEPEDIEEELDVDDAGVEDVDAQDAKPDVKKDADAKDANDTKDVKDVNDNGGTDASEVSGEEILDDVGQDADVVDDAADVGLDAEVDGADTDATISDIDAADADADVKEPPPPTSCVTSADCAGLEVDKGPCISKFACLANAKGDKLCVPVAKSNDAPCDDADPCTIADHCVIGDCIGIPKKCSDGNVCTVDSCKPGVGCQFQGLTDVPCDDGNPCTDGDLCVAGGCNPGNNKCECATDADCAPYESPNDLCDGKLVCQQNACVVDPASLYAFDVAQKLQCDPAGDTACAVNTCNPKDGQCALKPVINGTPCADSNACTDYDQCFEGKCQGGKVDCSDGNPCTLDACNPSNGCSNYANTDLCDDGVECTEGDVCAGGVCAGKPSAACGCEKDADCNNDGDLCNGTYVCLEKQCVIDPKTVIVCSPLADTVCLKNQCDPKTGTCGGVAQAEGKPCSDKDACTVGDACSADGECKPGAKLVCNDGNPCTFDACDANLGCLSAPSTVACDDGNPCTTGDKCASGKCVGGANQCTNCFKDADCAKLDGLDKCLGKWKCDSFANACEFDPATIVQCDASKDGACQATGCDPADGQCKTKLVAAGTPCADGKACTVGDVCTQGVCGGVQLACDDGNPCTEDACDEVLAPSPCTSTVAAFLENKQCDDGNACTGQGGLDVCKGGKCAGPAVVCDDGEPCTLDFCDPVLGCKKAPKPGEVCDDGNACTGDPAAGKPDACSAIGKCVGGPMKSCDDGSLCTDNKCDASLPPQPGVPLGCQYTYNTNPCDDGKPCTTGDACQDGQCKPGGALACDDANPCTDDSCDDNQGGCVHVDNAAPCDDGDVCTDQDTCAAKACAGKVIDCDDDNICTADTCDKSAGCQYAPAAGQCGAFAECSNDVVPLCVFLGGQHLVISEIYVGVPGNPDDDWVEIHNPTNKTADLGDYQLEGRPAGSIDKKDWQVLAKGAAGQTLPPYGYWLLGRKGPAQGGVQLDVADPAFALIPAGMQLRLRDDPHQLVHDRVSWGDAKDGEGVPLQPWSEDPEQTARSMERKANKTATVESMFPHKPEWLLGNAWDADDNGADFLLRLAPEPQNRASGVFEPACNGNCPIGKVCDFQPGGNAACVADSQCLAYGEAGAACGTGKKCAPGINECTPDLAGGYPVLSEIYMGTVSVPGAQFVELYNTGSKAVDLSGVMVQRKKPDSLPSDAWLPKLVQFPAGTILPPNGYRTIASVAYAELRGGIDHVVPGSLFLEPGGGALRLWDPRTGTDLDVVGWGSAKTFSGKQPAPALPLPGTALERKASQTSTGDTLAPGGTESHAGNVWDTDDDGGDWVIGSDGRHQSAASGVYEPSCGGKCGVGFACNYVKGQEQCVDPSCGGTCNQGAGCQIKTGQCAVPILIAEVATEGPASLDQNGNTLAGADNEYVVLYNPTGSAINLEGLAMQRADLGGTYTSTTDVDLSKKPLKGFVEPYGFFLIAPPFYDKNLPKPDFVGSKTWNLTSQNGVVRFARVSGTFPSGSVEADKVAWGIAQNMTTYGEGKTMTAPQNYKDCETCVGPKGALRRLPFPGVTAAAMSNPYSPWYYAGAGLDTQNNAADWVTLQERAPRNSKSPANKP